MFALGLVGRRRGSVCLLLCVADALAIVICPHSALSVYFCVCIGVGISPRVKTKTGIDRGVRVRGGDDSVKERERESFISIHRGWDFGALGGVEQEEEDTYHTHTPKKKCRRHMSSVTAVKRSGNVKIPTPIDALSSDC